MTCKAVEINCSKKIITFGWKLHWLCNLLNGFLSQDTGIVAIAGARGRRLWTGNVHFTNVFLEAIMSLEEGECLHKFVQFGGKKLALDGVTLLIERVFHYELNVNLRMEFL